MKKSILFFQICTLFFFYCNPSKGHRGASNSIRDSKKKNIFVTRYNVYPNPYRVNDTIQIQVFEAWLEHRWIYSDHGTITPIDGYQLLIVSSEQDLSGFPFDWSIGNSVGLYIRLSNKYTLISDFDSIPPSVIKYPVYQGKYFSSDTIRIGNFELLRE